MLSKKKLAINLVPQDPFLESPLGRFMQWAMGAGRYIIIFTEIVVILSFAARFILDRQVTDLNAQLNKLISYMEGYKELESQIRLVQAQTAEIKKQESSNNMLAVFEEISKIIPVDIVFSKLAITRDTLSAEGTAYSQQAFSTLVNNMQLSSQFSNVRIGKIESVEAGSSQLKFTLTANTREAPQLQNSTKNETKSSKTDVLDRQMELPNE